MPPPLLFDCMILKKHKKLKAWFIMNINDHEGTYCHPKSMTKLTNWWFSPLSHYNSGEWSCESDNCCASPSPNAWTQLCEHYLCPTPPEKSEHLGHPPPPLNLLQDTWTAPESVANMTTNTKPETANKWMGCNTIDIWYQHNKTLLIQIKVSIFKFSFKGRRKIWYHIFIWLWAP